MTPAVHGISSMATRSWLQDACDRYGQGSVATLYFESVGGVDAARRVKAGEVFDLVLLGADAMAALAEAGWLQAETVRPVVRSPLAAAVPEGRALPDLSTDQALRELLSSNTRIGCSTGPSGVALLKQWEAWGLTDSMRERLVVPPPGVPVGALVARGEVDLGFQQLSELLPIAGIQRITELAPSATIETVFAVGLAKSCREPARAEACAQFLADACLDDLRQRHGMRSP